MNKKETEDLAIDIMNHLSIAEKSTPEEAANSATDLCKMILKRYPKIRYTIWQWNQQHILDEFDLDYGNP